MPEFDWSLVMQDLASNVRTVTVNRLNGNLWVLSCTRDLTRIPAENHMGMTDDVSTHLLVWDLDKLGWKYLPKKRIASIV